MSASEQKVTGAASALDVVGRYYAAANVGQFERVYDLLAPDAVLIEPESLPYAGRWEGLEAWRRFGTLFQSIWRPEVVGPVELFPNGDRVAARFVMRLASQATGRVVDMPLMEVFTVRDGRIAALEVFYADTAQMLDALRP